MAYSLVDLFCGAGGMSLGFKQAGCEPVFAADWDQHACNTYRRNLGDHVHKLDLASISAPNLDAMIRPLAAEIDIVAGGPPCQGFSVQRRGNASDSRNDLVLRFGEFATHLRPKVIVMENVPTVLGSRGREHIKELFSLFEAGGYSTSSTILDASLFGVPQSRRRAFIVAVRSDVGAAFRFPAPDHLVVKTVRDAIGDLPPPPEDNSEHPLFANHQRAAISPKNLERLSYVPEGGGRLDIPSHLQLPCHRNSNGHRHLDVFGRLRWDRPSGTITAMFDNFTRGRFGHPDQNRNITNREGARLQSFPDEFVFLGPKKDVARQIGNAVCPALAQTVAHSILQILAEQRNFAKKVA